MLAAWASPCTSAAFQARCSPLLHLMAHHCDLKDGALQVWFEVSPHTGRLHLHLAPDGSSPLGFSVPLDECMAPVELPGSEPSEADGKLVAGILKAAAARCRTLQMVACMLTEVLQHAPDCPVQQGVAMRHAQTCCKVSMPCHTQMCAHTKHGSVLQGGTGGRRVAALCHRGCHGRPCHGPGVD